MSALEEEFRMPILPGEGPIGIILAPSRELVRQTYDVVEEFCQEISKTPGYPSLRTQLVIGGESVRDQVATLQSEGIHCMVATPGRLRDILKRKAMRLDNCRFICLDEADRLLGTCGGHCRGFHLLGPCRSSFSSFFCLLSWPIRSRIRRRVRGDYEQL